jgi:predicted small lipoprotein YifL
MPTSASLLLLATLVVAPLLGSCGQKGPLYLPDNPPPAETKKYPQKPTQPAE